MRVLTGILVSEVDWKLSTEKAFLKIDLTFVGVKCFGEFDPGKLKWKFVFIFLKAAGGLERTLIRNKLLNESDNYGCGFSFEAVVLNINGVWKLQERVFMLLGVHGFLNILS